jgi:hypothetical protein
MREEFKKLIKEAVLEALVEFYEQYAVKSANGGKIENPSDEVDKSKKPKQKPNSRTSSGGGTVNGKYKPNVGVGVWEKEFE